MITVFWYGWEIYVCCSCNISVVYQLICLSSADLVVIKQLISSDSELLSDVASESVISLVIPYLKNVPDVN